MIQPLFDRFGATPRSGGHIAIGGQIVDASLIAAPKQCNTEDEKKDLKEGHIPKDWRARSDKLRQKDRDARWKVTFSPAKVRPDGTKPPVDIAIPTFSYQNHIEINRRSCPIRKRQATDAPVYEGARLCEGLLDQPNTTSGVCADTVHRSKAIGAVMWASGFISKVNWKTLGEKPLPEAVRRSKSIRSKVHSDVEHVFGARKNRMGLFDRTFGIA